MSCKCRLCLVFYLSLSHVSCPMSHVPCLTVPCLMSHVSCPMSYCPMSHVPCLMSHVSCPMSHVPCLTVPCLMSHVLLSHVSCPMSHVPCLSHIICCIGTNSRYTKEKIQQIAMPLEIIGFIILVFARIKRFYVVLLAINFVYLL